jgi:hypothetical protein
LSESDIVVIDQSLVWLQGYRGIFKNRQFRHIKFFL